ncbi:MAG TPA: hypothetical protein PKJ14_04145 [Candidatus Cloacimonadota bacterium]|nr:hypothetical protein [Candidatus Cloacimonadota bacterium]HQL15631.1 hypothetical protein [Candidatus Cloacimonadota bacterium]
MNSDTIDCENEKLSEEGKAYFASSEHNYDTLLSQGEKRIGKHRRPVKPLEKKSSEDNDLPDS